MIDIIGYIKIDESKPERLQYLMMALYSYRFMRDDCKVILSLDSPADWLYKTVSCEILPATGLDYELVQYEPDMSYGENYLRLLKRGRPWAPVLHFHEDHFCVLDDAVTMKNMILSMKDMNIQVCRASFWPIECKSVAMLYGKMEGINLCWTNNKQNHERFSSAYPEGRFYIGTNNIMQLQFAKRFWDRPIDSKRPHEYEIKEFDEAFIHNCMVPAFEITASIDDDHGEPGSCLLKRDVEKFWTTWKLCNQDIHKRLFPNQ
ncbi:MAG TPA: hypothetical protein VFV08_01745 [Puia sp.]|nr:hypothetical protein [Puia sp.]